MDTEAAPAKRETEDEIFARLTREHGGEALEFTLPRGKVRCLFRFPQLSEWERLQNKFGEAKDRMLLCREFAATMVLHPSREVFLDALERNFAFPPRFVAYLEQAMGGELEAVEKKG